MLGHLPAHREQLCKIFPDLFHRLLNETEYVMGIKQSVGGIQALYADVMEVGNQGRVYAATDDMIYSCFDLGAKGAISAILSVFPKESVEIPALSVQVVDSVGAGDAMMAALIDSLARISVLGDERAGLTEISPQMLTSVGQFAVTAAAITVSRAGANPPTRDEVNDLLAKTPF